MFSNIVRILERYWNLFLIGTGYTLLMSAITVLFGLIFGALLALLRKNRLGIPFGKKKFYPIRFLAVAYIEISSRQTMMKIILPQAIKNILPAMGNEFIMMIKETSLSSTFFVGDLMTQYKTVSGALYLSIEPLMIVGFIYFILTFTLSKGVAILERRMSAGD